LKGRKVKSRPSIKQVVHELRAMANKHGYKVRYYTYSSLKDKSYIRNFSPQFPSGEFDERKKRILIRKYRNTFKHSIMCVLAHEIRHMLHVVEGKYSKYYSDYWAANVIEHYRGKQVDKLDISCFLQGIKAERDCDKWAQEFLFNRGYAYSPRMIRKYPISMVVGYDLYSSFIKRNT
jgi:hypothetical protein